MKTSQDEESRSALQAFIINLDDRPDRWRLAQEECRRVGLDGTRLDALRPSPGRLRLPDCPLEGALLGISASIDLALERAGHSDDDWVLILEDDVTFHRFADVASIRAELALIGQGCGVVQLGFMTGREAVTGGRADRRWRRAVGLLPPEPYGGHCLAVRPALAEEVRSLFHPHERPVDLMILDALRIGDPLVERASRSFATQRRSRSDGAPGRPVFPLIPTEHLDLVSRTPRILYLTDDTLGPVRDGGDMRTRRAVRSLRRHAHVDVVRLPPPPPDIPPGPAGAPRLLLAALRTALDGRSVTLDALLHPRLAHHPAPHDHYDLIWTKELRSQLASAPIRRRFAGVPTVVDLDDLDDRRLGSARTGNTTWRRRAQVRRARTVRRRVQRSADVVVLCSDDDAVASGALNAAVIPNTVAPCPTCDPGSGLDLVIVGNFETSANADGLVWVVEQVLPRLASQGWEGSLRVVGAMPPSLARRLPSHGVQILGWVDELHEAHQGLRAVLAPIRWGSGTRLKVVDAMARGLPVVATSVGAEGLDVTEADGVLIADDPGEFAAHCLRLLADIEFARSLGRAAQHTWSERFGDAALDNAVDGVLRRCRFPGFGDHGGSPIDRTPDPV